MEFPSNDLKVIIEALRGVRSWWSVVPAILHVVEYGWSVLSQQPVGTAPEAIGVPTTDADLADLLEGALLGNFGPEDGTVSTSIAALPWSILLPILIRLIERAIRNK